MRNGEQWWLVWGAASAACAGLAVVASVWWMPAGAIAAVATGVITAVAVRMARNDPRGPAAQQSRAAAERRAMIATAASHEIRNPLTMVAASAKLFENEGLEHLTEQQRRFLAVVRQQTDQAISIADDLLVQARIDAGRFSIHPTPTNVLALAREVLEAMKPIAALRDQVLLLDVPQYMPHVRLDPRAVRQALANLLMNAVRHTSEGRTILIRVRDNANALVLMVIDDGDGMSKEERRRLFEPFESGDLLGDGTGLGLNITRQLVEAHGGRILVDTRLREGTAIMITLPKEAS